MNQVAILKDRAQRREKRLGAPADRHDVNLSQDRQVSHRPADYEGWNLHLHDLHATTSQRQDRVQLGIAQQLGHTMDPPGRRGDRSAGPAAGRFRPCAGRTERAATRGTWNTWLAMRAITTLASSLAVTAASPSARWMPACDQHISVKADARHGLALEPGPQALKRGRVLVDGRHFVSLQVQDPRQSGSHPATTDHDESHTSPPLRTSLDVPRRRSNQRSSALRASSAKKMTGRPGKNVRPFSQADRPSVKDLLQERHIDQQAKQGQLSRNADQHQAIAEKADLEDRRAVRPAAKHGADLGGHDAGKGHGRRHGVQHPLADQGCRRASRGAS